MSSYLAGHIDQSIDDWWKNFQNDDGTVKTPGEIRSIAMQNGINLDNP
jgi:3-mercaptopyruvate sulfurtransferase SseA